MICYLANGDERNYYAYCDLKHSFEIVYSNDLRDIKRADTIIIPLNGLEIKKFKDIDVNLNDLIGLKELKRIICYKANKELIDFSESEKILLYELSKSEEFIKENSYLTAEGLLGLMITKSNKKIKDAKILVIGYGASGKEITRVINLFTDNVYVFSSKKIDKYKQLLEFSNLENFDFIINTAPVLMLNKEIINSLDKTIIYDISSFPGGTDFDATKAKSIKASLEPGIPGRFYALDSGKNIAWGCKKILWNW